MSAHEVNVVVGGGQAGATAVQAMRAAGFAGSIALIGAESHLPYERPPLSKEQLDEGGASKTPRMFDAAFYSDRAVSLHLGTAAIRIDRRCQRVSLSDGNDIAYDRLLLATGGKPRRLAAEGAERPNVLYLRTLDDSIAIERRLRPGASLAIIGGGFLGLEVAASAVRRACRVVVIEAGPAILGRIACAPVTDFVLDHHRQRGVGFRLKTHTVRIEGQELAQALVLSSGERIPVDVVVVCIGIEPETALAQDAGLDVADGIVTNEYCVTSDPRIFAAGDVTKHFNPMLGRRLRLESWQNAQSQAWAAGRAMAGVPHVYAEVPWIWSDQADLNLQFAGVLDRTTDVVLRRASPTAFVAFLFEQHRLVGAAAVNRGSEMALIRRMLASGRTFSRADLANPGVRLKQLLC